MHCAVMLGPALLGHRCAELGGTAVMLQHEACRVHRHALSLAKHDSTTR